MHAQLILDIIEGIDFNASLDDMLNHVFDVFKRNVVFESVGIRLVDASGDYPYYKWYGLTDEFVRKESFLCHKNSSGEVVKGCDGLPILDCVCGNVLRGLGDSSLPFYTDSGAFWVNSTDDLLASVPVHRIASNVRSTCNKVGFKSVGVFPLKSSGVIVGALHLNSMSANMFTLKSVFVFEILSKTLADVIYDNYLSHSQLKMCTSFS